MAIADITLTAFTLCNSLRVVAYIPQIARAATDRSGAQAISFGTWGLFLVSHASATAYALVNAKDWTMASLFLGNAVGCAAILTIAAWKRSRHRRKVGAAGGPTGSHVRFGQKNLLHERAEERRTQPNAPKQPLPIAMDFLLEIKSLGFANRRALLREAGECAATMAQVPAANVAPTDEIVRDPVQARATSIRRVASCSSMRGTGRCPRAPTSR